MYCINAEMLYFTQEASLSPLSLPLRVTVSVTTTAYILPALFFTLYFILLLRLVSNAWLKNSDFALNMNTYGVHPHVYI